MQPLIRILEYRQSCRTVYKLRSTLSVARWPHSIVLRTPAYHQGASTFGPALARLLLDQTSSYTGGTVSREEPESSV